MMKATMLNLMWVIFSMTTTYNGFAFKTDGKWYKFLSKIGIIITGIISLGISIGNILIIIAKP